MTSSIHLVLPELVLTAGALLLFLLDSGRRDIKKWAFSIAVLSLLMAGGLALISPNAQAFGVLTMDSLARFMKGLLTLSVLAVLCFCSGFSAFRSGEGGKPFSWGTFLGMVLLSTVGLFLLVCASDFLTILIAIELVSISSFVLTGYCRDDKRASEAAIKYFLVGGFSTGLMVFGMSLLYGVTGSTQLISFGGGASVSLPVLPLAGALLFVLAGFGFKLAMAPFHLWAPDVYEGAPTPITAFLSVAPKTAAFGMLIRFFQGAQGSVLLSVLALLSAVTMTVGNVGALRQTNLKRLLAYSSIAQMGYVLMGLVAGGSAGGQSVLIYLSVYAAMNLGAFASVIAVTEDARSESVEAFSGTAARSLPLSLVTAVFLLSLTGLPPLAGFVGKFSLFAAVLQTPGLVWLAVVAALNSVVSLVYYFSIVRAMFFGTPHQSEKPALSSPLLAVVAGAGAFTFLAGVFPNILVSVVRAVWP